MKELDELSTRKKHVDAVREMGKYLVDNCDRITAVTICYDVETPEATTITDYKRQGAYAHCVGLSCMLKELILSELIMTDVEDSDD